MKAARFSQINSTTARSATSFTFRLRRVPALLAFSALMFFATAAYSQQELDPTWYDPTPGSRQAVVPQRSTNHTSSPKAGSVSSQYRPLKPSAQRQSRETASRAPESKAKRLRGAKRTPTKLSSAFNENGDGLGR